MILDPIIMQYPENLNQEDFVIATYYSANKPTTEMLNYAAALAIEQTTGTWTKVPMETKEIRERSIGRVIGVFDTIFKSISEIGHAICNTQWFIKKFRFRA